MGQGQNHGLEVEFYQFTFLVALKEYSIKEGQLDSRFEATAHLGGEGLVVGASGHSASTVWKQNVMDDDAQLSFSFVLSPAPQSRIVVFSMDSLMAGLRPRNGPTHI